MDEKKIEKLQKEINENVQNRCPYRFDDPQTKIKDSCGLFDCHCVAMDSVYSHAENKKSICEVYNSVVPKRKRKPTTVNTKENKKRKRCVMCNKLYTPTGGRQKYCSSCKNIAIKDAARKREKEYRKNNIENYKNIMVDVTL
jgi:hypothetical protein